MKNNTKITKKTDTIKESCGCEKEGLVKKIKKKYMEEHAFQNVTHFLPKTSIEITTFTKETLNAFLGKSVLAESGSETLKGVLKLFKGNFIIENKQNKRAIDLSKLTKFICEDVKIKLTPKNNDLLLLEETTNTKNITEELKLYIKDQIKSKFFVKEEIVNPDNKGKLTSDKQKSRDKIASKLKNVKVVKGPPGRMDTPEEAKYRLATFIELNTKNK